MVYEQTIGGVRQILVPTDFSELSAQAVEYARDLAEKYDANLILLNVQAPPHISEAEGLPSAEALELIRTSREQGALARLRELFLDGEKTRYRVVTGYPEQAIPAVAQAEDADLIVMATHSRTGLSRMLEGSVTEEVLRLAPCPILALRG